MDQQERMAKVREARTARLGGKSPRDVGKEREAIAVNWIYRWGWTSPSILSLLVGDNRRAISNRLEKRGLVIKTKTVAGLGLPHVPTFILTLTKLGVEIAERDLKSENDFIDYKLNPDFVNQNNLRHDHIMQMATAKAVVGELIEGYFSPVELVQKSELNIKQPDAVWIIHGRKKGLEVELTGKHSKALDMFIRSCLLSLAPGKNNEPPRLDSILFVSDSEALIKRYQSYFKPGVKYQKWIKNEKNRQWEKDAGNFGTVPAWAQDKITWQLIKG